MKNNKIKFIGFLLVLTMISMTLAGGTLAKYTTKIEGNDTATARTFSFSAANGETQFAEADLLPAQFEPGEKGSFNVDLTNDSEVGVDLVFASAVDETVADFPIKYVISKTAIAPADTAYAESEITGATLGEELTTLMTGGMVAKTGDTATTQNIYVYWKWVEDNDTDINYQGAGYELDLSVTATQK